MSERGPYEQGVLFVHGIGNQKQGDTLVRWGDALTQWLRDWGAKGDPQTPVRLTDVVLHPADGSPAHGALHIGMADARVSWLVEEVWWGGEVHTPSYSRLAAFTVQALPMAVLGYVGGAFRRNRRWARGNTRLRWLGHWIMALLALVVGLPLALLMTPLLAVLIGALLLVGLIPVPGVRSRVQAVQRALTLTFGDSMILLSSPTQRAAMTSRVVQAIRFAEARGCQRLTIVAHSQGAAIVQRALAEHPTLIWPRLITVGSGINRLYELERLGKRGAWAAPAFLGGAALATAWLWAVLATTGETALDALLWAAGFVAAIALGAVTKLMVSRPAEPAGATDEQAGGTSTEPPEGEPRRVPWLRRMWRKTLSALPPTLFLIANLVYVAVAVELDSAVALPAVLLAATLVLGVFATYELAFRTTPNVEPDLKSRVLSWLDIYSHLDPVPGGPTRTAHASWPVSVEVRNTGSTVFDHVRYEREVDDALALIAQRLTEGSAGPLVVPQEDATIARRRALRQKRVTALRLTRWLPFALTGLFVLRHPGDVEKWGRATYDWARDSVGLPGWAPASLSDGWAAAVGSVLVGAGAVLAYFVLAKLWSVWNDAEARMVFAVDTKAPSNGLPFLLVAGWLGLFLVALVDDPGQLLPQGSIAQWVSDAIPLAVAFGGVVWAVVWCWNRYYTREPKVVEPKLHVAEPVVPEPRSTGRAQPEPEGPLGEAPHQDAPGPRPLVG